MQFEYGALLIVLRTLEETGKKGALDSGRKLTDEGEGNC